MVRHGGSPLSQLDCWDRVAPLVRRGALVVINDSGGKDSQAMKWLLRQHVRAQQLLIVHAPLGDVEWPGTLEHIEANAGPVPVVLAHAVDRRGERKHLLEWVERRGKFPDTARRWCTSDFKRGPIEREIKRYMKARGLMLVVNAMGMRAAESHGRAKLERFKRSERNSKAGRTWYDWLPIHSLSVQEVYRTIRDAGQRPHWAYAQGMTRLSCSFCIMASKADLRTAARLRPELYARYVELEERLGHTLSMDRNRLEAVTGIPARRRLPVIAPTPR